MKNCCQSRCRIGCRLQIPCRLAVLLLLFLFCFAPVSSEGLSGTRCQAEDLTVEQYRAMEVITESSVTGTIRFLASDELGGRGTPSKGFEVAAAYVASRLQSAGAVGLGPDGSFYLEEEIDVVQVPGRGFQVQAIDSTEMIVSDLLHASSEAVTYKGELIRTRDSNESDVSGKAVLVSVEDVADEASQVSQNLRRLVQVQAAAGAKVILLHVEDQAHSIWGEASFRQANPQMASGRGRGGMPIPVVLIGEISDTVEQVAVTVPALLEGKATVMNVCGVIRGQDETMSEEAVIFSAHLDHLGRTGGTTGDTVYNGADDDASGVTAVLTLADAYGALPEAPKRSVVFLMFWGEERGLLGSRSFVEDPAWPLEKTIANVNIEMVGRPEEGARNKAWMTGWEKSDLGTLFNAGSRRIGVETFNHPQFSPMLYKRSDNWAFAQKGVVAHSFSAGSLHGDYHQLTDEWEKLDLAHMTQVIRGLFAGSLPIVEGEATPKQAE